MNLIWDNDNEPKASKHKILAIQGVGGLVAASRQIYQLEDVAIQSIYNLAWNPICTRYQPERCNVTIYEVVSAKEITVALAPINGSDE